MTSKLDTEASPGTNSAAVGECGVIAGETEREL